MLNVGNLWKKVLVATPKTLKAKEEHGYVSLAFRSLMLQKLVKLVRGLVTVSILVLLTIQKLWIV